MSNYAAYGRLDGRTSKFRVNDVITVEMNTNESARLSRRELLKLSSLALAGAFGFKGIRMPIVEAGLRFSDWISERSLGAKQLAETFPDSKVVSFEKFPYNYYDVLNPEVDLDSWKLTVEGEVMRPGAYTLDQIRELPRISQNTRHICVEGWDVIGSFGGARISDFLDMIGASDSARFIEVDCADDYYCSIDMESARQAQSFLCFEMYGMPLD